jgi:hypothetical protein
VAPYWYGGTYRLVVPLEDAFPIPCCYQLELRAWNRAVVGTKVSHSIVYHCHKHYPYHNRSTYALGFRVCPPPKEEEETGPAEAIVVAQ